VEEHSSKFSSLCSSLTLGAAVAAVTRERVCPGVKGGRLVRESNFYRMQQIHDKHVFVGVSPRRQELIKQRKDCVIVYYNACMLHILHSSETWIYLTDNLHLPFFIASYSRVPQSQGCVEHAMAMATRTR
jgi:hypothetical protein